MIYGINTMKVIVADSFVWDFEKMFSKYNIFTEDIVNYLKKEKNIWENLVLNKDVIKRLDIIMWKLSIDFNSWKYSKY